MENQDKFNKLLTKSTKKVKDIRTYYYMVLGYLAVGYFIVSQENYDRNLLNISRNYSVWIVILWGIFLLGYGIYLFTPYFRNWEEKEKPKINGEIQTKKLKMEPVNDKNIQYRKARKG